MRRWKKQHPAYRKGKKHMTIGDYYEDFAAEIAALVAATLAETDERAA